MRQLSFGLSSTLVENKCEEFNILQRSEKVDLFSVYRAVTII